MTKPQQIRYVSIISTMYFRTDTWNSIMRCCCLWFVSRTLQNLSTSMSFVAIKFGYFRLLVSSPCARKVWNCAKLREDRQPLPLHLAVFSRFFLKLSLLDIYWCLPLSFGLFAIFFCQITISMDGPEKRPHLASGNTPNKPSEKRAHEAPEIVVCGPSEERPAWRTLAFHGKSSPSQKVLALLLLIEYFVPSSCAYLFLFVYTVENML